MAAAAAALCACAYDFSLPDDARGGEGQGSPAVGDGSNPSSAPGGPFAAGPQELQLTFQNGRSPAQTYAGTRDTQLVQTEPTATFGTVADLHVDGRGSFDKIALLGFDLRSVPPGSVVRSATLTVQVTDNSTLTYFAHPMTTSWDHTQASWGVARSGAVWTAGPFSATDHAPDVLVVLDNVSSLGQKTWSFTAGGLTTMQRWIDDPATNLGMAVLNRSASDDFSFASSDHPTPSNRPSLTVTYLPP